jgi:hypothetical protein
MKVRLNASKNTIRRVGHLLKYNNPRFLPAKHLVTSQISIGFVNLVHSNLIFVRKEIPR